MLFCFATKLSLLGIIISILFCIYSNYPNTGKKSGIQIVKSSLVNGELLLLGIGGSPGKIFNSCQTPGNSFLFYFSLSILKCNLGNSSLSLCEMGYAQQLSSKAGYAQLKGRAMPTIYPYYCVILPLTQPQVAYGKKSGIWMSNTRIITV